MTIKAKMDDGHPDSADRRTGVGAPITQLEISCFGSIVKGTFEVSQIGMRTLMQFKKGGPLTASITMLLSPSLEAQPFTNVIVNMPAGNHASTVIGDFNNDGRFDIFTAGQNNQTFTKISENVGNAIFGDFKDFDGTSSGVVAAGDFFSSGKLDALVTGINGTGTSISELWQNNGSGSFTLVSAGILPSANGGAAIGDLNNDGRLDLVLTGVAVSGLHVRVFVNLGAGVFTNTTIGITGGGPIFVADFDNDGYLDILYGSTLLRNVGNGTFTNVVSGLPSGAVAVADFNNDGLLDVLVANGTYQIWRNLGNCTFTNSNANLPTISGPSGLFPPVAAVGDYDNDGLVDIVLESGNYFQSPTAEIWRNMGDGTFVDVQDIIGVTEGTLAWADFDNDSLLDFVMTGQQGVDSQSHPTYAAQVWRNILTNSNTPPTAPTNLSSKIMGNGGVKLNWSAATDDHTPSSSLNYNIRVGTTPGGLDIVSPESDPVTGRRLVVQIGNAQERLFSLLTNLSGGTYYWSVQAIDTAFAGGAFANEASFIMPPSITGASYQSNHQFQVNFNALSNTSYTLQSSSTLTTWSFVTNVVPVTTGPVQLVDTNAPTVPRRYYRLSYP